MHEIYRVNLDDPNPIVMGPILQYPFMDVESKAITGFHVRGSTEKEKINLNKVLTILILHEDSLFLWNGGKLISIASKVSNFDYISDDRILFKTTEQTQVNQRKVMHSKVFILEALFSSYSLRNIYEDPNELAEILNIAVDPSSHMLLVLSGIKNKKERRDKFINLFDIEQEKNVCRIGVTNLELIGRLKSNLYSFVGGHIYYGNNVIKVRYDVISQGEKISETTIFDYYHNILSLEY